MSTSLDGSLLAAKVRVGIKPVIARRTNSTCLFSVIEIDERELYRRGLHPQVNVGRLREGKGKYSSPNRPKLN